MTTPPPPGADARPAPPPDAPGGGGTDRTGLLAGLGAYGLWGLLPLYLSLLAPAGPLEIVAHRVVWSLVLCVLILLLTRTWGTLMGLLRRPSVLGGLVLASLLIAGNWLVYVFAVLAGHTLDAALGYYLNPLVTVLLGVALLGERLRPLQWVAVGLGALAVAVLMVTGSSQPLIAVALALTFASYGLVKNRLGAAVAPVAGMAVETAVLSVPALGYLGVLAATGAGVFAAPLLGGEAVSPYPPGVLELLLVAAGVVTTVPLVLFATAARRLPLSVVGMLQFLTPTMQFAVALLVLGEPMPPARWAGFVIVWVAVVVLCVDMVGSVRRTRRAAGATGDQGPSDDPGRAA